MHALDWLHPQPFNADWLRAAALLPRRLPQASALFVSHTALLFTRAFTDLLVIISFVTGDVAPAILFCRPKPQS